jgi:hypothetical protein
VTLRRVSDRSRQANEANTGSLTNGFGFHTSPQSDKGATSKEAVFFPPFGGLSRIRGNFPKATIGIRCRLAGGEGHLSPKNVRRCGRKGRRAQQAFGDGNRRLPDRFRLVC